MKRAELESLGLTKEQVDAVIKINGADIENAKTVASAESTSLQTEVDALKGQIAERDKQIDGLKKSAGDNEDLKKQIETLQADNKAKDEAHAKELTQLKISAGNIKNYYYTGDEQSGTSPVSPSHVHAVGKIQVTVHNALAVGEEVILIRQQEGQKYIVIDRIGVI